MNSNSYVSILLAVFNGEKFIQKAITSVLDQNYQHWELIIVDNGSNDKTNEICHEFCKIDKRVFFYSLETRGKNNAFNYAYSKSKGNYICFFAADDMLTIDSLEKRTNKLAFSKSYSTCQLKTLSENPKFDNLIFPKKSTVPNYSGGSILFTRDLAELIFPLPISLPNEDTWASLHLRTFGQNTHVPKSLYLYRIHNNNSYGYDLKFKEKRKRFIQRMLAYNLFEEKWDNENINFLKNHIKPFIEGLDLMKSNRRFEILFVKKLHISDKFKLILYSSKFIYNFRQILFRLFSGIIN